MRKAVCTTFDGTLLAAARNRADLTVDDLAHALRAQLPVRRMVNQIRSWEANIEQPSFDRLAQLCDTLNVQRHTLLNPDLAYSANHWAREAAGLTISDVAERLGVTKPTVSRWDRDSPIPAELRQAVADLYNTDTDQRTAITIAVKDDTLAALDAVLARTSQTRSAFIQQTLDEALHNHPPT